MDLVGSSPRPHGAAHTPSQPTFMPSHKRGGPGAVPFAPGRVCLVSVQPASSLVSVSSSSSFPAFWCRAFFPSLPPILPRLASVCVVLRIHPFVCPRFHSLVPPTRSFVPDTASSHVQAVSSHRRGPDWTRPDKRGPTSSARIRPTLSQTLCFSYKPPSSPSNSPGLALLHSF